MKIVKIEIKDKNYEKVEELFDKIEKLPDLNMSQFLSDKAMYFE